MGKLKDLYDEIYEDRQDEDSKGVFMVCEDCKDAGLSEKEYKIYCPTKDHLKAHWFAHVKSKNTHPELKYEKSNIKVKHYKCHSNNDHGIPVKYNIID